MFWYVFIIFLLTNIFPGLGQLFEFINRSLFLKRDCLRKAFQVVANLILLQYLSLGFLG